MPAFRTRVHAFCNRQRLSQHPQQSLLERIAFSFLYALRTLQPASHLSILTCIGIHTYTENRNTSASIFVSQPVLFFFIFFIFFVFSPCDIAVPNRHRGEEENPSHHATVRRTGRRCCTRHYRAAANNRAGQSQQSRSLRHAQSNCVWFRSED